MNGSGNGVKIENEKINMFFVVFLLALFCCACCLFKLRMKKINVFCHFVSQKERRLFNCLGKLQMAGFFYGILPYIHNDRHEVKDGNQDDGG